MKYILKMFNEKGESLGVIHSRTENGCKRRITSLLKDKESKVIESKKDVIKIETKASGKRYKYHFKFN